MPDLPTSSSFIPKRAAGTKIRQKRTRNFFLLSIVSYACLIAAPTASAAVYVYQLYTNKQFEQIVSELEKEVGNFSEAEMSRVIEFDKRLKSAKQLVDRHVSVVKALEILEKSTAVEVGFKSLSFESNVDGSLTAEADLLTTGFDAALFQRNTYHKDDVGIDNTSIKDVAYQPADAEGASESVSMKGNFIFSGDEIEFVADEEVNDSGESVTDSMTDVVDDEAVSISAEDESATENVVPEVTPEDNI